MADAHPLALAILSDGKKYEALALSYLSKHRLDFLDDAGKAVLAQAKAERRLYGESYEDSDIHDAVGDIVFTIQSATSKDPGPAVKVRPLVSGTQTMRKAG